MLTIIDGTQYTVKHKKRAKYKCDCGDISDYISTTVVNKRRVACKTCTKHKQNENQREDVTGLKFGSLTAVKYEGSDGCRNSIWLFKCDCGNAHSSRLGDVKSGKTSRCKECTLEFIRKNAIGRSHYGDGASDKHRLYSIWKGMNGRAYHKKHHQRFYDEVTMCNEWRDFSIFREWAENNGYEDTLDLDKDILCDHLKISPKIYSPDTCLWIPKAVNARYSITKDLLVKEKIRKEYVLV